MKLLHENQEAYVLHLLVMVAASQCLIAALERAAKRHPPLTDECGASIEAERKRLKHYQQELRRAYALPG